MENDFVNQIFCDDNIFCCLSAPVWSETQGHAQNQPQRGACELCGVVSIWTKARMEDVDGAWAGGSIAGGGGIAGGGRRRTAADDAAIGPQWEPSGTSKPGRRMDRGFGSDHGNTNPRRELVPKQNGGGGLLGPHNCGPLWIRYDLSDDLVGGFIKATSLFYLKLQENGERRCV